MTSDSDRINVKSTHSQKIAHDLQIINEDEKFLRMLGQGFREYLGICLPIKLNFSNTKHIFGNDFPLEFDLQMTIEYENRPYNYSIHFLAQPIKDGKFNLKFEGRDMIYQTQCNDQKSANRSVYETMEGSFTSLFGIKGECPVTPPQLNPKTR